MADPFPHQFAEAAAAFPTFSTAFAQLHEGDQYIKLRIQSPGIMMQFAGDVQFGKGRPARLVPIIFDLRLQIPKVSYSMDRSWQMPGLPISQFFTMRASRA